MNTKWYDGFDILFIGLLLGILLTFVLTDIPEKDKEHYRLLTVGYNYCPYCGEVLKEGNANE